MTTTISIDDIYVWDNFLKEETFAELKHKTDYVPWKFCEVVSESGQGTERFMTFNIWEEGIVDFDPMNIKQLIDIECRLKIKEKMPNATIHDMKRLRFNGTMKGEGYKMFPHKDIFSEQETVWTIVHYIKGDGGTSFYTKKNGDLITTVDFKPNRAVMFPSRVWHNAESPETAYFRTSLGIVYMIDQ